MRTETLFITLTDIEERVAEFDANINPKQLRYPSLTCQDMFTRELLGDPLYFDILEKFDNGTLNAQETELVEYIKQHLIARICERSLMNIHNRITNKGVQNGNSDFSTASTDSNLFRTMNVYKNDAEFYERRLKKFIDNNFEDFPLYKSPSDDIAPMSSPDDIDFFMI
jgi:hypothetical protein